FPVADLDGSLRAGGCSPLSFAYFSLRRQRKVGAAPHRGNANKPITQQGKANTTRTPTKHQAAAGKTTQHSEHYAQSKI
ncbi:MAG: hypothetical protein RXR52_25745, partial [Paraburkholderia sp.]